MTWVHATLALTNIFGVVPLKRAWKWNKRVAFSVTATVMMMSTLMHLSETKHQLDPGPFWSPFSLILLNMDRFTAIAASIYFVCWGLANKNVRQKFNVWLPIALFAAGCVTSAIGEWTDSHVLYVIMHTLWHLFVYMVIWILIEAHIASSHDKGKLN